MIPMTKTVIIIDIKIIHKRIFGLSIQNKGPSTVKFTIFYNPHIALEMSQFYSCRFPIFVCEADLWIVMLSVS